MLLNPKPNLSHYTLLLLKEWCAIEHRPHLEIIRKADWQAPSQTHWIRPAFQDLQVTLIHINIWEAPLHSIICLLEQSNNWRHKESAGWGTWGMDLDWLGLTRDQLLIALPLLLNSYCLMGIIKTKLNCFLKSQGFSFPDYTIFQTDKSTNNIVLTVFMGKTTMNNKLVCWRINVLNSANSSKISCHY